MVRTCRSWNILELCRATKPCWNKPKARDCLGDMEGNIKFILEKRFHDANCIELDRHGFQWQAVLNTGRIIAGKFFGWHCGLQVFNKGPSGVKFAQCLISYFLNHLSVPNLKSKNEILQNYQYAFYGVKISTSLEVTQIELVVKDKYQNAGNFAPRDLIAQQRQCTCRNEKYTQNLFPENLI